MSIIAFVLLIGTTLALAGPAVAEDVDECAETPEATVCAYDSTTGDREKACDADGEGTYEGRTGAEARTHGGEPKADASATGEERCEHSFGYAEGHNLRTSAKVCLETENGWCTTSARWGGMWSQDEIAAFVMHKGAGFLALGVSWGEDPSGECRIHILAGMNQFSGSCPAEPPSSPNPGWGDITP